jgi:hypothetical protein
VTSYSYARGGEQSTFAGAVILAIVASLSAFLVLLGLVYAAGTPGRHRQALANAGCEPNLSPDGLQCTTVWVLEGRYTALTTSALAGLNTDVAAYTASEFSNLSAAKAALTVEVADARALDKKLTHFPWPPAVVTQANALHHAILARIKMMLAQAGSSSLVQMRSFNAQIDAQAAVIQEDMNLVHTALFKRPTAAQEPFGGSCGGVCPGQGVQPEGNP